MRAQYKKFFTVFTSAGIVGTAVLVGNYLSNNQQPLKASWTTSYEPSVKWDHNWDRRDPASLAKPKHHHSMQSLHKKTTDENNNLPPTPVTTQDDSEIQKHSSKARRHLFLIRHGKYEIKAKERDQQVLTQLGREQAEFTGKRLSELAKKFNYTKLHHSTMIRAVQTAEIIKSQLPADIPVHVDPLLCEGAPIPPEPPVGHWKPEQYQFFEDGSRIEAAFRKYFHRAPPEQLDDSYEIIVCHANVIRYFFCRAMQFPPEAWLRFDLGHGSITHIIIKPDGRVGCRAVGDVGFQPEPKISYS